MKFMSPVLRYLRSAERSEIKWLVGLVLLALSAWVFLGIADEVLEGDTHAVDRQIILALRSPGDLADPIGPGWVEETMRDFTALGGNGILSLVTLLAAGALFLARRPRAAWFLLVAIGVGLLLSLGLKEVFDRPRPDLVPHGSVVYTRSFPSGHSMLSAATYLTLAALLARQTSRRRLKVYVFACALLLTTLTGVSRVYLGVHWPTDVLAGWTAGGFWALLCWLVAVRFQAKGRVEREPPPSEPS